MKKPSADAPLNRDAWPQLRTAGVALHLTSLPGAHGIGELGAAARSFIDFMTDAKLRVWQFLPTGPTGFGNSPYQSLSSFAGNEMLIDVADLRLDGLVSKDEAATIEGFPSAQVDFQELIPRKMALIESVGRRFTSVANAELKCSFEEFVSSHDVSWLHDYALYRTLKNMHRQKAWPEWQKRYRQRDARALARLAESAYDELNAVKVSQFLFYRQWHRLHDYAHENCVTLFGDLPIYVALDSCDAWVGREQLTIDSEGVPQLVAGVPPDYFSEDGQLWGNPLYRWRERRRQNFDWWCDRLRHATTLADLLRIDHFRGFESYWAIEYGAVDARKGEWRKAPGDALFRELRIRLGELPIVAEDLGDITPGVESLRKRHGIPGMRVLQFEVGNKDFDIGRIPEQCVCYTGTHDNDTSAGWFNAGGAAVKPTSSAEFRQIVLHRCGGDVDDIHNGMIRLAYSSAARLAIAPLQDYLGMGSESRLNTPGTAEHNWRWRVDGRQLNQSLGREIAEMVAESGRDATT